MTNEIRKFDVLVIGGGPAGMMAAGRAAELGAKAALIEKNKNLGKKLLITGKGRCNITQAEFDDRKFADAFGKKGKFLRSSLSVFGPEEVVEFFEKRGLETKIERGKRVFPATGKSLDVLNTLIKNLQKNKVEIFLEEDVAEFFLEGGSIKNVKTKSGKVFEADNFILCVGGKAYPLTGSTGDGYAWAKSFGHAIINPVPALAPIKIKEEWIKDLQGLSLKNIEINIFQNNKKQDSRFGEMIFTHFGISGPIVLDVSRDVGKLLENGEVAIELDLKPALDFPQLDNRLQRDFAGNRKKDFKNYLPELLPQKMIEIFLKLSGIDPKKKLHFITKEERKIILHLLKEMKMTTLEIMGFDQAIVTGGGVNLKEIDSKTMRSKIVKNLFFAGEILDLDGPTGGCNLQICWSTGYAAGTFAIAIE
ncbi:MAG: NAD(P)/FAD-dependent oxidoreductase [bacterium]|nr:NAD(P)/FAD-dependent oxidoreductase [bacterium]